MDGLGNSPRFNFPTGISIDPAGNLFVVEVLGATIRKLSQVGSNWFVTT